MKKFIFRLFHTPEPTELEIYSNTYMEAKINASIATGCPQDKVFFVEETESHVPQCWKY